MSHTQSPHPYTIYQAERGVCVKLVIGDMTLSLEGVSSQERAEAVIDAVLVRLATLRGVLPRTKADQTPDELLRRLRA